MVLYYRIMVDWSIYRMWYGRRPLPPWCYMDSIVQWMCTAECEMSDVPVLSCDAFQHVFYVAQIIECEL